MNPRHHSPLLHVTQTWTTIIRQVGRQNHQLGDAETAIGQYQNALQLLSEAIDFREKASTPKMVGEGQPLR